MKHRLCCTIAIALATASAAAPLTAQTDTHRTARAPGATAIFNGRDLTGWEHVGPGSFSVDSGVMMTRGGMGLLWYTGGPVANATVHIEYRNASRTSNSGVFIRIPERPTEPWMPVNRGYEVQIDDSGDDYHVTGGLFSFTRVTTRPSRPGQWNTLDITIDSTRTRVSVNGVAVTNYSEGDLIAPGVRGEPDRGRRAPSGYIGLQNHSDKDTVYFRNIIVIPLARTTAPVGSVRR